MPHDASGVDDDTVDAARSAVEAYFGDLIDEVALHEPVTRSDLVDALAALSLAAGRENVLDDAVVRQYEWGEVVVSLDDDTWDALGDPFAVPDAALDAARRVHARMARALVGDDVDSPFVVVRNR